MTKPNVDGGEGKEISMIEKLDKLVQMCHVRGGLQETARDIPLQLDEDIAIYRRELEEALWRLEDLMF